MTWSAPCGWLLLDKPVGLSSAHAVSRVKHLFKVRRAGHAGTLDPLASGLLAIALGATTRWCSHLLGAPKSYRFTIRLGQETDSYDAEGLARAAPPCAEIPVLDRAEIDAILSRFTGVIKQIPPMYSALHSEGRRLYELAREGKVVERPAREVHIERLSLIADRREEWDIEVHCGKGVYVRSLGNDIGRMLGCGAYVSMLRRTGLGSFDESQAIDLEQLEASSEEERTVRLLPADVVLPGWPAHSCTPSEEQALRCGRRVAHPEAEGFWKLQDAQGRFFGIAESIETGWLQPRRLMV